MYCCKLDSMQQFIFNFKCKLEKNKLRSVCNVNVIIDLMYLSLVTAKFVAQKCVLLR